jgi:CxC2 like cysteine cluster associated with KDZ transposases
MSGLTILQSQNDFMAAWKAVAHEFLDAILATELPSLDIACAECGKEQDIWRCMDCFGMPMLCRQCLRRQHSRLPYHRVEVWSDTHFAASWLWKAGLTVNLGHAGLPCPSVVSAADDETAKNLWEDGEDDFTAAFSHNARPPTHTIGSSKVVTVLHTNGVHHCLFNLCDCRGSQTPVNQFLAVGLYPASLKDVRTAATFSLLDDHHMSIIECHASSYAFYNRLCRITNKAFPQTVPVSCPCPLYL